MKIRKLAVAASAVIMASCMLFTGCANTEGEANAELKEFVMVMIPGEDTPEAVQLRDEMSQDMSEAIGLPVTTYRATDYSAAIEAMRTGQAQAAILGPFSYVHAVDRAGAECMAVSAKNGVSGYQSYIVARKDSGLTSIEDLKGKTFAFVDPESTSGNIVPSNEILNAFAKEKLTFDDLHINGNFFESVMFAGNHSNSLQGVARGDVDAAAVSSSTFKNEIKKGNVNEDELLIIHESPMLPSSPICIQKDLPQELKDKVKEFLLSYDNDDYFGGPETRYIEVKDEDYDYIRELKEKFNLED